MTRRALGGVLAVVALVLLAAGQFVPGAADAAGNGAVQLSVGGRAFTDRPVGPLLDTSSLVPGAAVEATLGVRSRFAVATTLSLHLYDVHDDDNGCGPAEAPVDQGRGAGQGELGRALVVTVESSATRGGAYRPAWRGAAEQLVHASVPVIDMPAHAERWLLLSASVPASVGNTIEGDSFGFGLRAVLQGDGVSGGSGVDATSTGRGTDTTATGAHTPASGIAGLAATGVSTVLFVTGGTLLVASGAVLLSAGSRRRRAMTASSSTARRGPRPASPR